MIQINWEYVIFESTSDFYEQRPKTTLADICNCSKCFPQVTKKSFYWKLGSFMGASWHVKGYELLEFLNKQSNLRKKRIYSVPGSYLAVILLLFQHFIIFSYADRKKSITHASYTCCMQGKNYQLTEKEPLGYVHSIALCYYVSYISYYVHSFFLFETPHQSPVGRLKVAKES